MREMNEPMKEQYDIYGSLWRAIKSHEHWYWLPVNLALTPVYLFYAGLIFAQDLHRRRRSENANHKTRATNRVQAFS